MNKLMNLKRCIGYRELRMAACVYVALPLAIFLLGFLKWYLALISFAALVFAFLYAVKSDNIAASHEYTVSLKLSTVFWVFLFTLIWTYFGGMNGYWYQSIDWGARNPIYFDLIQFDWPVVYEESGDALVYYIGHWLPPAFVGKLVMLITGSFRWGRFIGRMALWGWSSIGLTIVILLLFHFLKATEWKKRFFAVLIFVCFSGLDILGAVHTGRLDYVLSTENLHLEWWSPYYQFTSITACVYWVFNQTIVPWIITLCFMMEKDARNYIFYGVACLICGPFPCVGLAACMIVKAFCYCIKRIQTHQWRGTLKRIFSPANWLVLICVFPCVASFILTNNAISAISVPGTDSADSGIALVQSPFFSREYWNGNLFWFLLLEVGLYMLLVFIDHKKNPMFYTIGFIFVMVPYFRIGVSYDFCMRVSVPAIFILMLYVNDFLLKHFTLKPKTVLHAGWKTILRKACALALACCFLVGMATPVMEVYRGFYHVLQKQTILLEDMSIGTFSGSEVYIHFGCSNPEETFFFRYLAR